MSIINTKNGLIGTGTFDAPTFGVGLDTLVLGISQDAWANGDAISDAAGDTRFAVMVGGVRVGPIYTAQVAHGAGQQNFTIHLNAPAGNLAITVSLINDAWGGTPQTDRNLYVNSLTYNGVATGQSATLLGNGTATFAAADTTAAGENINGTVGNDTIVGSVGNDVLNGLAGNDKISGLAGNDTINGGDGADTMIGGVGNDTYFVDTAADVITEVAGQGSDIVWASADYTLAAGASLEFLFGNTRGTSLRLTGNDLNNTIAGSSGDDVLRGGGGNDVFRFNQGQGHDLIVGFEPGPLNGVPGPQDLIDIRGRGITLADFPTKVALTQGPDGSTHIAFAGSNDTLDLVRVPPSGISVPDFRLA